RDRTTPACLRTRFEGTGGRFPAATAHAAEQCGAGAGGGSIAGCANRGRCRPGFEADVGHAAEADAAATRPLDAATGRTGALAEFRPALGALAVVRACRRIVAPDDRAGAAGPGSAETARRVEDARQGACERTQVVVGTVRQRL